MIWFIGGQERRKEGVEKAEQLFVSWQNLILLPKLPVELQCDYRCSRCLSPSLPPPGSLSRDSACSLGSLHSLGKSKPLLINPLSVME